MNLIIYINDHFEEERALFDLDSKKVILNGDYYHDKIDDKIEGYIMALKDHKIIGDIEVPDEYIDNTHKYFKVIGFYE